MRSSTLLPYSIIGFLKAIVLVSGSFLYGQQNLDLAALMKTPFPSGLVHTLDGNKIAWVYNDKGVRNIWISSTTQGPGKQLSNYSQDDGQTLYSLSFTPDGIHLIYVRGDAPNRRGEIPNPTSHPDAAKREIWKIPVTGGKPEKLSAGNSPTLSPDGKLLAFIKGGQVWKIDMEKGTSASQMFKIRGSASQIRWASGNPSHKLAFVSNRGDHSYIGVYRSDEHSLRYISPSVDHDSNPTWSPDGTKLAFLRIPHEKNLPFFEKREGPGWSVMVADPQSGAASVQWTSSKGSGSAFRGISASNQLFWTQHDELVFPYEGSEWMHLYRIKASGATNKAIDISPGEAEVQYVSMNTARTRILFSSNHGDINRQHIWKFDTKTGSTQSLSAGKGIEWAPIEVPGGKIFCFASGPRHPAHIANLNAQGTVSAWDSKVLNDFPSSQLTDPQAIVFSGADGMQIHGQLFLPNNIKAGDKLPALIFFHGGSRRQMLLGFHHRGYYHNAYALNQYMANKGYVVLSVNYRSGTGYGMKFREALNYGANGASEFNDVVGAGLYLQNRADVDPKKIGLWGGSYGGYLTALGLARAPHLFAAGVDIHGVHDWNVVIKNFVPGYNPEKQAALAKRAYQSSPMNYMDGWKAPVLLIHGDDDRNVPFSETVDIANALRKRDVYFEQLIFPDEVHGFLLHKNWMAAYTALESFFDRKLKNKK